MNGTGRSARAHVAAIQSALEDGDNEDAADLAGQGVAAFPDAAVFHCLRGIALFALGANGEAKRHLATALAVDPLDNAPIIALAALADVEGDPYTAAEHLLTAWEHDPASRDLRAELSARLASLYGPEGYLQFTRPALAALYVRNLYPERAAREYRAILAEHPNRMDLRVAAALARWRLGNLAEAAEECTALLATQPKVVPARWALADALARLGNGDLAREHAKQAACFDPDGAIARALIASNPEAAIVDPDEPLHVPDDWRARLLAVVAESDAAATEPGEREAEPVPPFGGAAAPAVKSDTMRLVEALSGLAAALVEAKAGEFDTGQPRERPEAATSEPEEPALTLPGAAGLAEAIAALDRPLDVPDEPPVVALPHPLDVPYVEREEEEALVAAPTPSTDEPEPVIAVVDDDGMIVATQPGGEPSLDATDALPLPTPAHVSPEDVPSGDMIAAMLAKVHIGDVAGAVGAMRAALAVAGTDRDELHALLPGLRALVDATPDRPDTHRLLGDAYLHLGLYAQAQGQYRQALLIRVAGKRRNA